MKTKYGILHIFFIDYIVLIGLKTSDWPPVASMDLKSGHISGLNVYTYDVYQMKALNLNI